VNAIALLEQEFTQIGAILTGDADDECDFLTLIVMQAIVQSIVQGTALRPEYP
jgi:hypothetical protein